MNERRISIHIATRDRHSELFGVLQSLRNQCYQKWDLVICDQSITPVISNFFLMAMINRLKQEGHYVRLTREDLLGVCIARNKCIEVDNFDNEFTFRCDDDVILESNYLLKLLAVINEGYDMATGLIPGMQNPPIVRETRFLGPIISEHKFNEEGQLVSRKDELAFLYDEAKIIPTHHFRTHALYRTEMHEKGWKYPDNLSPVGFREEGFFSMWAILNGYKIGAHTGAIAWHLMTPSGGCRHADYQQKVQSDDKTFQEWLKAHYDKEGDFLTKYNKEVLK